MWGFDCDLGNINHALNHITSLLSLNPLAPCVFYNSLYLQMLKVFKNIFHSETILNIYKSISKAKPC